MSLTSVDNCLQEAFEENACRAMLRPTYPKSSREKRPRKERSRKIFLEDREVLSNNSHFSECWVCGCEGNGCTLIKVPEGRRLVCTKCVCGMQREWEKSFDQVRI